MQEIWKIEPGAEEQWQLRIVTGDKSSRTLAHSVALDAALSLMVQHAKEVGRTVRQIIPVRGNRFGDTLYVLLD